MATSTGFADVGTAERRVSAILSERLLWWAFAATFFTLGFSPYRLSFSFLGGAAPINIPIPTGIMLVAAFLGWIRMSQRRPDPGDIARRARPPYGIFYAILLYFFFSAFFASDEVLALRDASKLLGGIFIAVTIAATFPDDERLLGQVWTIIVWTSAAIFAALIYQYAVVFQAPYLGANFETMTRELRNQLLWYLVFVLPFALTHAIEGGRPRLLHFVPLLILIVAWIYGSSRNTWLSVVFGLLAIVPALLRERRSTASITAVAGLAVIVLIAAIGWSILSDSVGEVEAGKRFQYLYDPASVPEYDSYGYRTRLAEDSLTIWLRSPIVGVGLSSTGLTHSDYPALLAETGIIGFGLFMTMLLIFAKQLLPMPRGLPSHLAWMSYASRAVLVAGLVSLAAINGYNSPIIWSFLGLAYKTSRLEKLRANQVFT